MARLMEQKGHPRAPQGTKTPIHRAIGWGGFLVLLFLHLDFWRPQRVVLYFGWLPEELLYRLIWMLLAFFYLVHHCTYLWTRDEAEDL